ncbi:hypothetical protein [Streptomyces sp. KL2]|uniref:hypothetical protein n=1 Tax=Streptomyces sp. KL2 TaxID=3050126 RepID=UPI00397C5383
MSTHGLLLLLLTLIVLLAVSAVAGVIGYGTARWEGAAIPGAITRGGVVFAGTLTIGIALLAMLLPAVT